MMPALVELTFHAGAAVAAPGVLRWQQSIGSGPDAYSSPVIGNLDGSGNNDAIVGSEDGKIYAFDAAGSSLPGWPVNVGTAVDSSPAIGDLDGNGHNVLVVGMGSLSFVTQQGGVAIIEPNGQIRCRFQTQTIAGTSAVFNAPAIGPVLGNGQNQIVVGTFDQHIYVLDGHCNKLADYVNGDSVWSAPALYDTRHVGKVDIFIGGDSSAGGGGTFHNGGIYRSLTYQGGTLVERWERSAAENFENGSSIGDLEGNGRLAVVTGSGAYWCRHFNQCSDSSKVWAFHLDDGSDVPGWPKATTYNTFLSAPALVDLDGDGKLDVVIGSAHYANNNPVGGAVNAFLSSTGYAQETWISPLELESSPIVADFGSGSPQIAIGGNILDRALNVVGSYNGSNKTAAAYGQLAGRFALVSTTRSSVSAYDMPTPSSAPWPQFQQNAQRTGSPSTGVVPPVACTSGYRMVAADGGIFNYGNAPFDGSAGGIHLNSPIVGMSTTPSAPATPGGNGYWLAARDGGIFNYGVAGFHGSAGGISLNSPVIGMAGTAAGNGYWLAAADGGIFNYGGAGFQGSAGGIHLNSPVVGIAGTPSATATPGGSGYWLVARDGGIFNYGVAGFQGSAGGIHLNSPIVGMAAAPTGDGYWLVAADGGIFNYGTARFFGSTGSIHLNSPIVGMRPTPSGQGYWLVAADGGIFNYGDAQFCGSAGNIHLNSPVVGMG